MFGRRALLRYRAVRRIRWYISSKSFPLSTSVRVVTLKLLLVMTVPVTSTVKDSRQLKRQEAKPDGGEIRENTTPASCPVKCMS